MIDVKVYNCTTCPCGAPIWVGGPSTDYDHWERYCGLKGKQYRVLGTIPLWCPLREGPKEARLVIKE